MEGSWEFQLFLALLPLALEIVWLVFRDHRNRRSDDDSSNKAEPPPRPGSTISVAEIVQVSQSIEITNNRYVTNQYFGNDSSGGSDEEWWEPILQAIVVTFLVMAALTTTRVLLDDTIAPVLVAVSALTLGTTATALWRFNRIFKLRSNWALTFICCVGAALTGFICAYLIGHPLFETHGFDFAQTVGDADPTKVFAHVGIRTNIVLITQLMGAAIVVALGGILILAMVLTALRFTGPLDTSSRRKLPFNFDQLLPDSIWRWLGPGWVICLSVAALLLCSGTVAIGLIRILGGGPDDTKFRAFAEPVQHGRTLRVQLFSNASASGHYRVEELSDFVKRRKISVKPGVEETSITLPRGTCKDGMCDFTLWLRTKDGRISESSESFGGSLLVP